MYVGHGRTYLPQSLTAWRVMLALLYVTGVLAACVPARGGARRARRPPPKPPKPPKPPTPPTPPTPPKPTRSDLRSDLR